MRPFGDLEAAVMQVLWQRREPATVRDVLGELAESRPLAYTTVMTVMNNLHRKGQLQREMEGQAWRYTPIRTQVEHSAALLHQVLEEARNRDEVLMHFVSDLDEDMVAMLRAAVEGPRRRSAS